MMDAEFNIELVPLTSIKRYLAASGWRQSTLPSGLEVFSIGPKEDEIEIVLPPSGDTRNLRERIVGAITTLAALEQRTVAQVISEIRAISFDLVRSRLPDSVIRHGTIRLKTAEEFIRRMWKMLAAAAHSEFNNGPYFMRMYGAAQEYADECRFGHTFHGSFGFTIESPVGPQTKRLANEELATPPLERRAIRRFARGLQIIEAAIKKEDPSGIVEGYEGGLNANACEELAALVEVSNVPEIKFEIIFSPEWGIPPDLGAAPVIDIRQKAGVEVIREAAKMLRVLNNYKVRNVVGHIRALHSKENPSDLFNISGDQDIIIEWMSDEYGRRNVRVSLSPQEYLRALDAHAAGRKISIVGELEQGSRQWRLENPRDFAVL